MHKQLKLLLIVLLVVLGQTLATSLATAHDTDPAHAGHDCTICLTVQINDTAPPAANDGFEHPPASYWAVGDMATQGAVLKARSGSFKARAPPR